MFQNDESGSDDHHYPQNNDYSEEESDYDLTHKDSNKTFQCKRCIVVIGGSEEVSSNNSYQSEEGYFTLLQWSSDQKVKLTQEAKDVSTEHSCNILYVIAR